MSKNTQSGGSLLMKLLPNFAKSFLESATQEDVVKAEQEAAAIHQKLQALPEGTPEVVAIVPPAEVPELTAMTQRATVAETKVTELQGQLTTTQADRDKYKAWHDKQSSGGTKLPTADAANRTADDAPELSAATADALAIFKKRKATI